MLKKILAAALMFVLIVGVFYLWTTRGQETPEGPETEVSTPAETGTPATEATGTDATATGDTANADNPATPTPDDTTGAAPVVREMEMGNADAPLTVTEYASFTCPHCARFHETVFGALKQNYIDTGKVHFIQRDVYFDRFGLWAAMLARCGGGSKYFGIADLLFTRQREWTKGENNLEIVGNLKKIGALAGMGADAIDACLQDQDKARALVDAYQANAERDGIDSTPSFLINGKKYPNMTYEDFAKTLDGLLAGQ